MTATSSHDDAPRCPACGYDLFGIDSPQCPECGLAIDRVAFAESHIPWTHRRRIGRIRAFFRTAALATFHPNIVAEEMNRPVSYADAQKFRHMCIAVAGLSILALVILLASDANGLPFQFSVPERIAGCALVALGTWLFLLAITGLPSLFFHPRYLSILRQNRAIALSYYAAAPLIALLVSATIAIIGYFLGEFAHLTATPEKLLMIMGLVAFILPAVVVFYLLITPVILLKRTTQCPATRCWVMSITLLIGDAVLLYALGMGIPLAGFFVAVIYQSLR